MQIADSIEKVILNNQCEEITEYGDKVGKFYSQKTIAEFKNGVNMLRQAFVYVQRIDYLLEGDDSEESFHKRLSEEF